MKAKEKPRSPRAVAVPKSAAPKLAGAGGKAASASASQLAAENAALKKQLAAAEQKVALLERQRDEALNRIAWVIDSINSLAESVR